MKRTLNGVPVEADGRTTTGRAITKAATAAEISALNAQASKLRQQRENDTLKRQLKQLQDQVISLTKRVDTLERAGATTTPTTKTKGT